MTNYPTETWRPVPGFPGYQVSNLGTVFSNYRGGRELAATPNKGGYRQVKLRRDGVPHTRYVHELVALTFLGRRPSENAVRHLNGDQRDNRVDNLAYGTSSENALDRVRHGNDRSARNTHCPQGHPYSPENTYHQPSRNNARVCRTCSRAHARASYARKMAQVSA